MPLLRSVLHIGRSIAVSIPKGWIRDTERKAGKKIVCFSLNVNDEVIIRPVFEDNQNHSKREKTRK